MRLASKIFLTSAVVIIVLAGVAALSLRAINGLVSANRDIATRTVPALRITAAAREAIEPLMRLEAHAVALGDPYYTTAWTERAAQVADDLERLGEYALSSWEKLYLREASAAFDGYRRVVAQERALVQMGDHRGAVRLTDVDARALAERVEERLGALMSATHTRVLSVEADASRVEGRIALGGAVALALLGAAFLAHRMTRSLDVLSSAAAAIAAGKFRGPIVIKSRDEIGSLARSFNAMVGQLRRAEETRRDFFATVSHELRSPLTSIRGAAELLREGVPGPLTDKQKRLADIVSVSSGRLLRLVNQILEMSRLQAGLVELERSSLDLAELVDRAVEELHPLASEATVTLECERIGAAFIYSGDVERLHQVIVNLGANAIRFTPPGGRVVARVIDAGPEFELQVEDTGVGIPADALPHIFDAYRQAHRERGGTGLGLAIVRGVVSRLGGQVAVESTVGIGTTFTVTLPAAARPAAPPVP